MPEDDAQVFSEITLCTFSLCQVCTSSVLAMVGGPCGVGQSKIEFQNDFHEGNQHSCFCHWSLFFKLKEELSQQLCNTRKRHF